MVIKNKHMPIEPIEQSTCLPFWEIGESKPRGFEPCLSQTNDLKIDTFHYLACYLVLLGYGKEQRNEVVQSLLTEIAVA